MILTLCIVAAVAAWTYIVYCIGRYVGQCDPLPQVRDALRCQGMIVRGYQVLDLLQKDLPVTIASQEVFEWTCIDHDMHEALRSKWAPDAEVVDFQKIAHDLTEARNAGRKRAKT